MVAELITEIQQGMAAYLDNAQMMQLQKVLSHTLFGVEVTKRQDQQDTTRDLV